MFLYKGKTARQFVNKQLTLATILSKLNRKKTRVVAMAHPNGFSAASKQSDYQIKWK